LPRSNQPKRVPARSATRLIRSTSGLDLWVRNGPIIFRVILTASFSRRISGSAPPAARSNLLSINYDVLPNIYAPKIVHGAKPLGVLPLLPSRSLATRLAACWAAILVVSGCRTPVATPLTTVSHPRLASGQPDSLDQTYASEAGQTVAVTLQYPSSPDVAYI